MTNVKISVPKDDWQKRYESLGKTVAGLERALEIAKQHATVAELTVKQYEAQKKANDAIIHAQLERADMEKAKLQDEIMDLGRRLRAAGVRV